MADSDGPLGADILVEILSRSPAKDLFRFQCVSRSWRALIRDVIFRRKTWTTATSGLFFQCVIPPVRRDEMYFRVESGHAPLPPSMVVAADSGCADDPGLVDRAHVSLDFLPRYEVMVSIVGCCNGLLLCDPGLAEYYLRWFPNSSQRVDENLYVCNPATKRWVAVPKPFHFHNYSAVLAFDPQVSPHFRVAYLGGDGERKLLSVFYAETGKWVHRAVYWEDGTRVLPGATTIGRPEFRCGAVVLGDGLYVLVGGGLLARFDLSTGDYSTVKLPEEKFCGRIGESQGFIYLAVERYLLSEADFHVDVWILRDWQRQRRGEGEWVKRYEGIDVHALALEQHSIRRLLESWFSFSSPQKSKFLGFHPHRDTMFILLKGRRVIACDFVERALHNLCDVRNYDNRSVDCQVFPFSPCPLGC